MVSSEQQRGNMMGRVLLLVRELVRGRPLDRQSVSTLLDMTPAAADRFLRSFAEHWPELSEEREDGKRVVRWSRSGVVPDSVAVAACFGASISRLFEGSNYESGLREARQRVVAHVRRPKLFEHFDRKFHFVQGGGEMMLPDNAGVLDDLVDAVLRRNFISMTYRRFDGVEQQVRVRPLSIVVYDHQLYVVGRDEHGLDHPFRFSRIAEIDREEATFAYPSKAEYDPDRLFADSFGIFVGPEYPVEEVQLRLHARWSAFVEHHRWHRTQQVVRHADHIAVRMRVRICPEVEAWILGFGEQAEVIVPEALRKTIRSRVRAMATLYERNRGAARGHRRQRLEARPAKDRESARAASRRP
jgi:hypothetical protein